MTKVLPTDVNVAPTAVIAALLLILLFKVAVARGRAMVDVPTMRDPAKLREYSVPLSVMPGEPGRSVEAATSKPPSPLPLPGSAVSVCEFMVSIDDGVGKAVEIARLEVPIRTPDGPRDIRVSEIVTPGPPCVRKVLLNEKTKGWCGEGVAVVGTGVYVVSPITMGLESACAC